MVATPAHRRSFDAALEASGIDLSALCRDGQDITRDAIETLPAFMVDGAPDPCLFSDAIGSPAPPATTCSHGRSAIPRRSSTPCPGGRSATRTARRRPHDASSPTWAPTPDPSASPCAPGPVVASASTRRGGRPPSGPPRCSSGLATPSKRRLRRDWTIRSTSHRSRRCTERQSPGSSTTGAGGWGGRRRGRDRAPDPRLLGGGATGERR